MMQWFFNDEFSSIISVDASKIHTEIIFTALSKKIISHWMLFHLGSACKRILNERVCFTIKLNHNSIYWRKRARLYVLNTIYTNHKYWWISQTTFRSTHTCMLNQMSLFLHWMTKNNIFCHHFGAPDCISHDCLISNFTC